MSVIREVAASGAAFVILLGITLAAAVPRAAAQTPPPPDTRPGVPSDAELESSGAVIGRIVLNIANIFNEADPRENKSLYRLANRLHVKTREPSSAGSVWILRVLILRSGWDGPPSQWW